MKILIIAPSAYPLGGVAVWIDYLIPGLEALGFECTLGLASGRFHDVEKYLRGRPPLRVVMIRNQTGSSEGRRRAIVECIELVSPDAILGVNIADVFPAVRRIRCKGGHQPRIIMTLHAIEADLFADMNANADLIDAVIASNHLACALSASVGGMDPARIYYAPYGVPLLREPSTSELSLLDDIRVAWIGRFEQEQKRLFDLEHILDRLASSGTRCTLRMVGDGPDRTALESRLRRFTEEGSVEWVGAIRAEDMTEKIYPAVDVLLVTSMWETGPIIIWEAMAAGVPVVSSRYIGSGLEGALRDGENCLLFDIGDAAGAASAIERLRDPTLRARIIRSGLDLVGRRYSINASVIAWKQAISSVLEAPSRRGDAEIEVPARGRLDRWLGVSRAEMFRRWSGTRFQHADAGGEWPHSLSFSLGREELWRQAHALDSLNSSHG